MLKIPRSHLGLLIVLGLLLGALPIQADPLTFSFATLPADGIVSGFAGSTVGWGYALSNLDTVNWLLISLLVPDSFSFATPDGSIFDYPILGPGDSVSVAYDPATFAGLFQITWDFAAPAGLFNSGNFALTGQFFDGDPLKGGNAIGSEVTVISPYTASVSSPAGTPVPEPATLAQLLAGLAVFGLVVRAKVLSRTSTRLG